MPLTAVQKQAVLDQYLLVKTIDYTKILQGYIKENFRTHESLDNIRHLISRSLGEHSLKRRNLDVDEIRLRSFRMAGSTVNETGVFAYYYTGYFDSVLKISNLVVY